MFVCRCCNTCKRTQALRLIALHRGELSQLRTALRYNRYRIDLPHHIEDLLLDAVAVHLVFDQVELGGVFVRLTEQALAGSE